jgi:nicotinamidase/pyrazinamidase
VHEGSTVSNIHYIITTPCIQIFMKRALIIVDVQNDFLPGGPLGVPEGDRIGPVLNRLLDRFDTVVATQDWHPAEHGSFAANHPGRAIGEVVDLHGLPQILWPVHCVQGSAGADFAPGLDASRLTAVFPKGTDATIDSYSGFFDNGQRQATGLGDYLKEHGIETVFIGGLATDYCVKATVLDALRLGFTTHLLVDATRGVNLQPGDVDDAIAEMVEAGALLTRSAEVA